MEVKFLEGAESLLHRLAWRTGKAQGARKVRALHIVLLISDTGTLTTGIQTCRCYYINRDRVFARPRTPLCT